MKRKHFLLYPFLMLILFSCDFLKEKQRVKADTKPFVVHRPYKMEEDIRDSIEAILNREASLDTPRTDVFRNMDVLYSIYQQNNFHRIWSADSAWYVRADSFYTLLQQAEYYGLFAQDYHYQKMKQLREQLQVNRKNASLWSTADMLMSDAFISFAHDLKLGRIPRDSVTLKTDSVLTIDFYSNLFAKVIDSFPRKVLEELEPSHEGYRTLKNALPSFLKNMKREKFTYVQFPQKDSLSFVRQLQQRLFESGFIPYTDRLPDSADYRASVKLAQRAMGITEDGKPGIQFIKKINDTDWERFSRIAINLDRYKQLPDSMPSAYIWVNLPAFKLEVYDSGRVILESKVIVGQPKTRTPILNSKVTNMITYPQWTVPYSIIFKEMIPKIRKDINYLNKENLMVVDRYDSVIDPYKLDWNKLGKNNFPYLLRQRQGDDNSLGVIKFNFSNKFSVYMHDTNARSLFSRSNRALSHGCVRVQAWDTLSRYLLARDSANIPVDSLKARLSRQEKHHIPLRKKLPVYFRYFTTYVDEKGEIRFLDDIYWEDNSLIIKHLSKKL